MPIGGTRQNHVAGSSYKKDPLYPFAKLFCETAQYILDEDGLDIFEEPSKIMRRKSSKESMRKFFVENSTDTSNTEADPEDLQDMEELLQSIIRSLVWLYPSIN